MKHNSPKRLLFFGLFCLCFLVIPLGFFQHGMNRQQTSAVLQEHVFYSQLRQKALYEGKKFNSLGDHLQRDFDDFALNLERYSASSTVVRQHLSSLKNRYHGFAHFQVLSPQA